MAFLRRKNGAWHLIWREGGKQRSSRISKNPEIARKALRRWEDRNDRARAGVGGWDPGLTDWTTAYLAGLDARVAAGSLSPSTAERAREAWGHLLGWLEAHRPQVQLLSQLTPEVLRAYQLARIRPAEGLWKRGARARTVNTEFALFSPAFRQAVRESHLTVNPLDGITRLRERDSARAVSLTADQVGRLLLSCRKVDPDLYPYLAGYVFTGARRNELQSVEWRDVDLVGRVLQIPNLKIHRDASNRDRTMPIHPKLAAVLRRRKSLPQPWPPIPPETLRRRFLAVTRAARMPWLTQIHGLRHTFGGLLVSAGVDLYAVSRLLGHLRIETTQRYARLAPETLRRAVGKIPI